MESTGASAVAHQLYKAYVTDRGLAPPDTSLSLLTIINSGGAEVLFCEDAPPSFIALQVGERIYVNLDVTQDDRRLVRVLAHEWAHFLRRKQTGASPRVFLYASLNASPGRDFEEQVAIAFQRYF